MEKNAKIYVAGHRGLVGSAITRKLQALGYNNLLLKTRDELDLLNQKAVADWFAKEKPDYVFLAAAKVGGINANNIYRADFIYENLEIQNNIIHSAYTNQVKKLLFLGSSCIYPKLAPQPLKEEYLLSGFLEETNEPYALAKIAGLKMCQAFNAQYKTNYISVMPTNLYGPGDNFNLADSHVLPALLRKFSEAVENKLPEVSVWGTGTVKREFLYVDDLADAVVYLMNNYQQNDFVNIGTGEDISIKELAEIIAEVTGFTGKIVYDHSKPDGTPQKLLDVSRLSALGWKYKTPLKEGIKQTLIWYKNNPSRK